MSLDKAFEWNKVLDQRYSLDIKTHCASLIEVDSDFYQVYDLTTESEKTGHSSEKWLANKLKNVILTGQQTDIF